MVGRNVSLPILVPHVFSKRIRVPCGFLTYMWLSIFIMVMKGIMND